MSIPASKDTPTPSRKYEMSLVMIYTLSFAQIGLMVRSANSARAQAEANRSLQKKLHGERILENIDSQRRQFAQNIRQIERNHELTVDTRAWPLVHSPAAVRARLSHGGRLPLLALFAPPPDLKCTSSVQSYSRELKSFVETHLSSTTAGVLFLTGFWRVGCELDDAAVSALQSQLPEHPMVLLSFAALPGDCVEPRFAYLPGPGGNPTTVRPLCEKPIEVGRLARTGEKVFSDTQGKIIEALRAAGFSDMELQEIFGQRIARNHLIERAEGAILSAGLDVKDVTLMHEFYNSGKASLASVDSTIADILKVALLIATDGHNLISRKLPPILPELFPTLRESLPQAVVNSLNSALDGYEALFSFPTLAGLPAVMIARERLLRVRAEYDGKEYPLVGPINRWASSLQLTCPDNLEDAIALLISKARKIDAGFVEWLGTLLEAAGEVKHARTLYKTSDDLLALSATPPNLSIGERK